MSRAEKMIEGIKLSYIDTQKGKNILFCLPPHPAPASSYLPFINILDSNIRIIALDLPGWGGFSSKIKEPTIDNYVFLIEKFITSFSFKKYSILGYSYGGIITLNLLKRSNIAPQKVILISTFYDGTNIFSDIPDSRYCRIFKNTPAYLNKLVTFYYEYMIKLKHFRKYLKVRHLYHVKQLFEEIRHLDVRSVNMCVLDLINHNGTDKNWKKFPILLIYSSGDMQIVKKQSEEISKYLNIKPVIIPKADHHHFYFEAEKSYPYIEKFISGKVAV